MMRGVPHAAVTYATFDTFSRVAQRLCYTTEANMATNFLAGSMAAVTGMVCFHPLDVLRTRMATGDIAPASHFLGLKHMFARGGIVAMYEGLGPAALGMAPMAGIGFAVYLKGCDVLGVESFHERVAIGTVAGAIGQLCTYPLNVRRRQALVEDVNINLRGARQVGFIPSLYRRAPVVWLFSATTFGLSFAVNDQCRSAMLAVRRKLAEEVLGRWS